MLACSLGDEGDPSLELLCDLAVLTAIVIEVQWLVTDRDRLWGGTDPYLSIR